jgi:hypothetical protein
MNGRYLVVCLILAQAASARARPQSAARLPAGEQAPATALSVCGVSGTYDQLTDPWRHAPVKQDPPLPAAPIELTIQSTEFSDRPVTEKITSITDFCYWNALRVGVYVSAEAELIRFRFPDGHSIYGEDGGDKLPPEVFARLEALMNDLPDDGRRVPPPQRRVFVVVRKGDSPSVRLYDSGNLPDSVIEMIQLTGARIKVVMPALQSDNALRPDATSNPDPAARCQARVFYSVNKDCSLAAEHDLVTKTLIIYQRSQVLRVIQEFWQPDVYGGYAVGTEFSPDNRYLLVGWGWANGILLYDTSTWEPVTDPNLFPQRLLEYLHSPDWSLGIGVNDSGEALLWDWRAHRIVAKLPGLGKLRPSDTPNGVYNRPGGEIQSASFSPDGTRVAITGPDGHISVWETATGRKLRDFPPPATVLAPRGKTLWWNDGRWLVAGQGHKGIWDTATGRFLGSLDVSGCDARDDLTIVGERLHQSCFTNNHHPNELEWTVGSVQRQLDSFARQVAKDSAPKVGP